MGGGRYVYRCLQVIVEIHLRLSSKLRSNQTDDPHGRFAPLKFGDEVANVAQMPPSSRKMHHSCGPKRLKRARWLKATCLEMNPPNHKNRGKDGSEF